MRLLLKEDEIKYTSTVEWINKNWYKRTPDYTNGKKEFFIKFSLTDIEHEILCAQMQGKNLTTLDLIKDKANSQAEYVVPEINIKDERINGYITACGDAYSPNAEFLEAWNEKLKYEKLKSMASKYLTSLGYDDQRNFYEDGGSVYYGQREQNKYDARLLGDIVSGTIVVSSEEYDKILTGFKTNN